MNSMLESVRRWLATCPVMAGGRIGVDYLADEADSWAIAAGASQPKRKEYINGSYIGQFEFTIANRRAFGDDLTLNEKNIDECEKLAEWLGSAPTLPDFGEEKNTQKCEVVSGGYISSANARTARYEIRARIIYIKH